MPLEDSEATEFQIACPFCGVMRQPASLQRNRRRERVAAESVPPTVVPAGDPFAAIIGDGVRIDGANGHGTPEAVDGATEPAPVRPRASEQA